MNAPHPAANTLNGSPIRSPTTDDVLSGGRGEARNRNGGYYVDRAGWDYSAEAARAGMARAYIYDRPMQRAELIAAAEREAQAARRGLWGPPCKGRVDR